MTVSFNEANTIAAAHASIDPTKALKMMMINEVVGVGRAQNT